MLSSASFFLRFFCHCTLCFVLCALCFVFCVLCFVVSGERVYGLYVKPHPNLLP